MEWVETTGKTIEEAISAALDQLGVDETEVEYEVLDEPKAGLFGRVRGEARVRARVKPTTPRAKDDRRRKPAKAGAPEAVATAPTAKVSKAVAKSAAKTTTPAVDSPTEAPAKKSASRSRAASPAASSNGVEQDRGPREAVALDDVASSATSFLAGFFAAADLDVEITTRRIDDETLEVRVDGQGLGVLVGPKGATLLALQELVRTHVHHSTGGRSGRLMLDVAGYREKRRAALIAFTQQVAQAVIESGERRAMEPMTAVDRKVIHDAVHDIDGVASISEGEDPDRRVVLIPA